MNDKYCVITMEKLEKLFFPKIYELKNKNDDMIFNINLEVIYDKVIMKIEF